MQAIKCQIVITKRGEVRVALRIATNKMKKEINHITVSLAN